MWPGRVAGVFGGEFAIAQATKKVRRGREGGGMGKAPQNAVKRGGRGGGGATSMSNLKSDDDGWIVRIDKGWLVVVYRIDAGKGTMSDFVYLPIQVTHCCVANKTAQICKIWNCTVCTLLWLPF